MGGSRMLTICLLGYLLFSFLSVFSSVAPPESMRAFVENILSLYIPVFGCLLLIRTDRDVVLVLKIIVVCVLFICPVGLAEFIVKKPVMITIFPEWYISGMLADFPTLASAIYGFGTRSGLYRAVSVYNTALSFGEFAAMAAPLCAFLVFHANRVSDRLLGSVALLFCMVGIACSGARGAYMGIVIAIPLFLFLWALRRTFDSPRDLVSVIFLSMFAFGAVGLGTAILSVGTLYKLVLGGGEVQSSNESRYVQWNLAKPQIASNPVTGHGLAMAGKVVGYYPPGSDLPTVDSSIISIMVETGVPGLGFFFGMIAFGAWGGIRIYLRDPRATAGSAMACSLLAFGIYRIGLSQRENHFLFFLIIALLISYLNIHSKKYNH